MARLKNYLDYEVTTGTTITVGAEGDNVEQVYIYGSETLVADLIFETSNTEATGSYLRFFWGATVVPDGNNVIICGKTIPETFHAIPFTALCRMNGGTWEVAIIPDFASSGALDADAIADLSITTNKLADASVTLDKLGDLSTGSIWVGVGNRPIEFPAGNDGDMIVYAGGIPTLQQMSGDATMDSAGSITVNFPSTTLQNVFDNGNTIVVADTENKFLSVVQNDTTNNPCAVYVENNGTGDGIFLLIGNAAKGLVIDSSSVARIGSAPIIEIEATSNVQQPNGLNLFTYTQDVALVSGDESIIYNTIIYSKPADHPNSTYIGNVVTYAVAGSAASFEGYRFQAAGTIDDGNANIYGYRYDNQLLTHTNGTTYAFHADFGTTKATAGNKYGIYLTGEFNVGIEVSCLGRDASGPIESITVTSNVEQDYGVKRLLYDQLVALTAAEVVMLDYKVLTCNTSDLSSTSYFGHKLEINRAGSESYISGYLVANSGIIDNASVSTVGYRFDDTGTHTDGIVYGFYSYSGASYAAAGTKYGMCITGAFDIGIKIDPILINTSGSQYTKFVVNAGTKFSDGVSGIDYTQDIALGNGDATYIRKTSISDKNTDSATSYYYGDYTITIRTGVGTHYSKYTNLSGTITAGKSYGYYLLDNMTHTAGDVYGYYGWFAGAVTAGSKVGMLLLGKMTTGVQISPTMEGSAISINTTYDSDNNCYGVKMDLDNAGAGAEFAFGFSGREKAHTAAGNLGFLSNNTGTFTAVGYIKVEVGGNTYYMPYGTIA